MSVARAFPARRRHDDVVQPARTDAPRTNAPRTDAARTDAAEVIAARALDCLRLELETWPKRGLVSHVDRGSHDDMDAATFRSSIAALAPYLHALAEAGARACGMDDLRQIGLDAEAAMLAATSGVNTHRGAIFGLGLLCAAAGAAAAGRVDARLRPGGSADLRAMTLFVEHTEFVKHSETIRLSG